MCTHVLVGPHNLSKFVRQFVGTTAWHELWNRRIANTDPLFWEHCEDKHNVPSLFHWFKSTPFFKTTIIFSIWESEDWVRFCTADSCSILCCSGRPCEHELIAPSRIAVPRNDEIRAVYRKYLRDVGYNIAPTSSIRSSIGHKIGFPTGNRVQKSYY